MVIVQEYSFCMVEHHDFRESVKTLQSKFTIVRQTTINNDCIALY
ncbi:hypothetical protein AMTRI_Chr03g45390 [Amborella trichopoda]